MRTTTRVSSGLAVLALLAGAAGAATTESAARPAPIREAMTSPRVGGQSGVAQDAESPPSAAEAPASSGRGYTYLQADMIAETPAGFQVWVNARATHHRAIASTAEAAVKELHALGINIRWRGYGYPSAAEGVVRISEGSKGCGGDGSTVGMTWTSWHSLPSGKEYASGADIYLCPRLFGMGSWATQATVRHELGHAMGLGHTNYRYDGSYQVMNASVRPGVTRYRPGDRAGLRRLAENTRAIKSQIPPTGHLDASTFQPDDTIQFQGWALLQYDKAGSVTVLLTDNGTVIYRGGTPIERPDVNRNDDPGTRPHGFQFDTPWTGGTHQYCITVESTQHPAASAQLGCVTWRS